MMICPQCAKEYPEGTKVCPKDKAVLRKSGGPDPLIGKVLKDAYKIEERIGTGGMSTIYRAQQLMIERPVAIKLLLPHLQPDESFVKRFFREAQILGRLNHPNIVALYDCGQTEEGWVYLVTEFLEGQTLARAVPAGMGLPFPQIVEIMKGLCSAVADAHAHDVVHRDLKPSNVFIIRTEDRRRHVKVLDFGIAKSLESHAAELTKAGAFVGTPGYMAPEQVQILTEVDGRADIYALGALLYLMAAGRPAFDAERSTERVRQQLEDKVAPVDLAALQKPQELTAVIHKALQADPAARYGSALEFFEAVERCGMSAFASGAKAAIGEGDPTLHQKEYTAEAIAQWRPSADPSSPALEKTRPIDLPTQLKREKKLNRVMLLALSVALAGASYLLFRVVQLTRTGRTEVTEVQPVPESTVREVPLREAPPTVPPPDPPDPPPLLPGLTQGRKPR